MVGLREIGVRLFLYLFLIFKYNSRILILYLENTMQEKLKTE